MNKSLSPIFVKVEDNEYVADMTLSGDMYLSAKLPVQGKLAIRHINKGKSPIVLASTLADDFQVRIFGDTKDARISIHFTAMPTECTLYNI